MKRVLFISDKIWPEDNSGIPIITYKQAFYLKKMQYEIAFLNVSENKEIVKNNEIGKIYFLPVYNQNFVSIKSLIRNLITKKHVINKLNKILDDFKPNIIHINSYFGINPMIFKEFKKRNIKVIREVWFDEDICFKQNLLIEKPQIQTCTGPENINKCKQCFINHYKSNLITRLSLNILLRNQKHKAQYLYQNIYDKIVFPDEDFKNIFLKYINTNNSIAIINHGLDFSERKHYVRKYNIPFRIVFLGSLITRKGIDIFLKSIEELLQVNFYKDKIEVYIYGYMFDNEYAQIIKKLRKLYPNHFFYEGNYTPDDLNNILKDKYLGIVPSYSETYCRVLREFVYYNIPVITTNFYGHKIIKNNENGIIIKTGDAMALLSNLKNIINNQDFYNRLANGVSNTKLPTIQEEINALIDFYS